MFDVSPYKGRNVWTGERAELFSSSSRLDDSNILNDASTTTMEGCQFSHPRWEEQVMWLQFPEQSAGSLSSILWACCLFSSVASEKEEAIALLKSTLRTCAAHDWIGYQIIISVPRSFREQIWQLAVSYEYYNKIRFRFEQIRISKATIWPSSAVGGFFERFFDSVEWLQTFSIFHRSL